MTMLNVRIIRNGDPPPMPETMRDKVDEARITEIVGIESGTQGGKPSIAIIAETSAGRIIFAETTLALLRTSMAAFDGAFGREP